jgi:hypothetical protein
MRLNSSRHAASTSGSAISCSYVSSCHLTEQEEGEKPEPVACSGFLSWGAHIRQRTKGERRGTAGQ